MERWALIEVGCAECGTSPLVFPRGIYNSAREAAEGSGNEKWSEHPAAGFYSQSSQGALWIVPLEGLSEMGSEVAGGGYGGWTTDTIRSADLPD